MNFDDVKKIHDVLEYQKGAGERVELDTCECGAAPARRLVRGLHGYLINVCDECYQREGFGPQDEIAMTDQDWITLTWIQQEGDLEQEKRYQW